MLEGGKITGKTDGWTLGVLEAVTQARDFRDPSAGTLQTAPSAFFGVARIGHSIFQKSEIGLISVNRAQNVGATFDQDGNLVTGSENDTPTGTPKGSVNSPIFSGRRSRIR